MDSVAALKARGLADVLSYWAVSDVFEEAAFPPANASFHGNFGIINMHGNRFWNRTLLHARMALDPTSARLKPACVFQCHYLSGVPLSNCFPT
jgi:hypothetical protein